MEQGMTAAGSSQLTTQKHSRKFEGDATDILIPRIFAVQKTSKILEGGTAKFGQLVRSTTSEVLGGLGVPVPIIPLKQWKDWMVTSGGKFKFRERWDPMEPQKALEFTQDGQLMKRERCLNFYVLLPGDVSRFLAAKKKFEETGDMPEGSIGISPCQIMFKSTSYNSGKGLVTHFAEMEQFGVEPYRRTLLLDSELGQNDKGKYSVLKVLPGASVKDPEHLNACRRWLDLMSSTTLRVDDELEIEHVEAVAEAHGPDSF